LLVFLTAFAACDDAEEPKQNQTFTLSSMASPTEGGEVKVSPSGSSFDADESVSLTAEPNSNWVFQQWEGDGSGSTNPLALTMNSDKSVTAVFVKRDYPLNLTIEGEGTVGEKIITNPSAKEYPYGTTVELTPIPAEGWAFESWGGDLSGDEVPKQITVDGEANVTVVFKEESLVPITRTHDFFGLPYLEPACKLLEYYSKEDESLKTRFIYNEYNLITGIFEVENGVVVDTSFVIEYNSIGFISQIKDSFYTISMEYNSNDRLEKAIVKYNSSEEIVNSLISYPSVRGIEIKQGEYELYFHEYDQNYNLSRRGLKSAVYGKTFNETTSTYYTEINNFTQSLGDFRFVYMLAGDYVSDWMYELFSSKNFLKRIHQIEYSDDEEKLFENGIEVISVNSQNYPTEILIERDEVEDNDRIIFIYECN
tara:strand:+ start:334 stop:1605 length:1272 start_codon:yes stop_codon:yes gene_type:complete